MPSPSLFHVAYAVAYRVLPHYAFNDLKKVREISAKYGAHAGAFFYLMACQMMKVESPGPEGKLFLMESGALDDLWDYYLMIYPGPPPLDLRDQQPEALLQTRGNFVLAPYFSAILHRNNTEPRYYVLGQAPFGGTTTFRSVTADHKNCNLGPGPAASKDKFLARIRQALR